MIDVVGRRVRAHRTAMGLSLDQLAARAGVSKGSVVAIEAGAGNPSLSTLVRIADAFGVSVSVLLEDTDRPRVRVVEPGGGEVLWRGKAGGQARLLLTTGGASPVELWRWELPAGERYDSHPHPGGVMESVTVIEGNATLVVAGHEYPLAEGSVATFAADVDHSYAGAGQGGARLLMTVHLPVAGDRGRP